MLARLFTRPANVLVLDEPTNDLDLETLELLEAQLVDWPGTLLLVSHDRAFLDNVVTSTLVFEGDGRVQEYVGGYEDWLRQRPAPPPAPASTPVRVPEPVGVTSSSAESRQPARKKLSFNERRELDQLPARIEALETEQQQLEARVADPEFYKSPAQTITDTLARLDHVQATLLDTYARWDELDSRA